MANTIPISIKHGGKQYPFELDTTKSVPEFREEVYNKTGVAPAQQKILIKGVLKDDANFQKLGLKNVSVLCQNAVSRPSSTTAAARRMHFRRELA